MTRLLVCYQNNIGEKSKTGYRDCDSILQIFVEYIGLTCEKK